MKTKILVMFALLLGVLAPTAASAAENDARVHLIHGIPATDVDVEIAGDIAIDGFEFGDTFDLSGFAGQTLADLKVKLAGTDTVAIDAGDTAVPATGNYTIIAHLDEDGNPALAVFENDVSKLTAGEGRIVVRHAAAAPTVDVLVGGDPTFTGLVNGGEAAADLAAGTLSVSVVPAGTTTPVVIGPADFDVTEGESLIVYAVGSLSADSLTVLTEELTEIHGSPNVVNTGDTPVDDNSAIFLTFGVIVVAGALFRSGKLFMTQAG